MRIGLIIYDNLDLLSGGYIYDRMLVNHLIRQGDEVEILSFPSRNYLLNIIDNFSPKLSRLVIGSQVDILLEDELNHPSLFLLNRRLQQLVECPIISVIHHLRSSEMHHTWQNFIHRRIERHYLDNIDGFIYNSRTTKEAVEKLISSNHAREYPNLIAYPGKDRLNPEITEAEVIERAKKDGPLNLIFLGNLIPRKGLHILLQALKGLNKDLWKLTVVGNQLADISYAEKIKSQTEGYGLKGRVQFTGTLTDRELTSHMKINQLLVIPSYYEGYGIAYIEGMGFGLPAIGTVGGGAEEIIVSGLNGFLVQPGDASTIKSHVEKLSEDRELLAEMSLAALRFYENHSTWKESMSSIRNFLVVLMADN
jgi:glycosyltransferase involved in cell wall biosynthesis